ncbi:MAG: hypothetical protein P1U41_00200 [Vicingaceae bacterium]|nr:hypothetical protein [Vicingaceae bacterium]
MKYIYSFFAIIFTLLISQCNIPDSDRDQDTSVNSSKSYAKGQSDTYEIFKLAHYAANSVKGITNNNLANTTSLYGCDTLIIDTISNPMTITIQFNGSCYDKTGSITLSFSNKYDVSGSLVNVNFNNYTQYNLGITGNLSYSFNGKINNLPNYTLTATDVTYVKNNNIFKWSGIQTIEIVNGSATASILDDTYNISGTASGVTREGNEFIASINSDLTLEGNCNWISSGIVQVTPENKAFRILDFGSGCNNLATTQLYDIVYDITIP